MKRLRFYLAAGLFLLVSCNQSAGDVDREPDVAVSKIVTPPLLASQQSGGAGGLPTAPDENGVVDLLNPRNGPVLVPATTLFDPITGATTENPLQVYVTASDELGVVSVELFANGQSVGTRTKAEDGINFKNPFVFPADGSSSLPIVGAPSGLTEGQLSAVAIDSSGQQVQSEAVELQIDGSRPDIDVFVTGDGTPGPVSVSAQAADPDSTIRSFSCELPPVPGEEGEPEACPLIGGVTGLSGTVEGAGSYTFIFTAVNGAGVANTVVTTFTITDTAPSPSPDNTSPTVTLTPSPALGPAPLTVNFAAQATDADDDTLTYSWDFGDGSPAPSGGATQSHTYAAEGTYTATVTVSDGINAPVQASVVITVGDDDGPTTGGTTGGATTGSTTGGTATGGTTGGTATGGTTTGGGTTTTTGGGTTTTTGGGGTTTGGGGTTTTTGGGTSTTTGGGTTTGGTPNPVSAEDDSTSTDPGEAVDIAVLENDEPGTNALTIVAVTSPRQGGVVEISRDRKTISYTPPSGFTGTDTFRYTVSDSAGNRDDAGVGVVVE